MLDPTILLNLQPDMPPARPDVGIERRHQAPRFDAVQRLADRKASQYEATVSEWVSDLRRRRTYLEAAAASRDLTAEEAAFADRVIEDIETEAELRARGLRRLMKRMTRDLKRYFELDASLGAALRTVGDRLSRADERAIEELLEHALHVRAFRAARSPGARGGPVFDDPDALDAYLKAELA